MSAPEPVQSVRLIFEYEGDKVRLVSQQPVDMVVTGFDLPLTEQLAYHVEARDVNDKTLARVPARNALERSMEVFPEHPGEPIVRHDVPVPKGAFTVVVPAPAGGAPCNSGADRTRQTCGRAGSGSRHRRNLKLSTW